MFLKHSAVLFIIQCSISIISCYFCSELSNKIKHNFSPLRHCQRSNRTVIGMKNVENVEKCADFARSKRGLAFNYSPTGRNRTNFYDISDENGKIKPSWKKIKELMEEEFYNCHVLDCPEYKNLSTIVNDTRYDYYTLYAANLRKY